MKQILAADSSTLLQSFCVNNLGTSGRSEKVELEDSLDSAPTNPEGLQKRRPTNKNENMDYSSPAKVFWVWVSYYIYIYMGFILYTKVLWCFVFFGGFILYTVNHVLSPALIYIFLDGLYHPFSHKNVWSSIGFNTSHVYSFLTPSPFWRGYPRPRLQGNLGAPN